MQPIPLQKYKRRINYALIATCTRNLKINVKGLSIDLLVVFTGVQMAKEVGCPPPYRSRNPLVFQLQHQVNRQLLFFKKIRQNFVSANKHNNFLIFWSLISQLDDSLYSDIIKHFSNLLECFII